jgi:hypothetical protein
MHPSTIYERLRTLPVAAQAALAFCAYLALAVDLTWPMPRDPGDIFYGGIGDPIGSLATMREHAENFRPPYLPGTLNDFNAPEGLSVPWVRSLASLPSVTVIFVLSISFSEVVAYNIYVLLAYPLSGLAGFLLARKLTKNSWVAVIAGFAFAFYPYAIIKGQGHYDYVHGWPIVLAVWRMLELMEKPTRSNGFWAGLAVLFAMAWTPYYILLVGVAYLALVLVALGFAAHDRDLHAHVRAQAVAAGMVSVFLVGFLGLSRLADAGQGLRTHGIDALNVYSARVYEYFVPHGANVFVGDRTAPWIADHLHGSNYSESTLYLGLSVLLLALVGLVAAVRGAFGPQLRRVAVALAVLAFAAVFFSAPPEGRILGATVPFPSHFVTEVTSTWRVYARFVIVAMLAVSMLAALGAWVLVRSRPPWLRAVGLAAIATIVVLDLAPRGQGTNPLVGPSIARTLARLPDGIVVQYPLVPAVESLYEDIFNQQYYDKPLINGYQADSSEEARALALADPSNPRTGPGLASLGVKYALVFNNTASAKLPPFSSDFKLVAQDASGRVYKLDPSGSGIATAAVAGEGFNRAESDTSGSYNWLLRSRGTIDLTAACQRCSGTLHMRLTSFARPRTVLIRDARGRTLARRRVTDTTAVRIPLTVARSAAITVLASPGPQPVAATLPGSTDPRSVSIAVRDLRFEARG